jgi:hypothetical protein
MPGSIRGALAILCATATSGGSRLAATEYLPDPAEAQSNVECPRSDLPEYICHILTRFGRMQVAETWTPEVTRSLE